MTSKKIHDFLQTFDKEDLTEGIWCQLKKRLEKDVESEVNYQRYAGILRNLIYQTNDHIEEKIEIESSSVYTFFYLFKKIKKI